MCKSVASLVVAGVYLLFGSTVLSAPVSTVASPSFHVPPAFVSNHGQWSPEVHFRAKVGDLTAWLTPGGVVYGLRGARELVRARFLDARPAPVMSPSEPAGFAVNFLYGSRPDAWVADAGAFGRVTLEQIYPGIDAAWYLRDGRLEYDLILAGGADPGTIRMAYEGADTLAICDSGDLLVMVGQDTLRESAPVVWANAGGSRHRLDCRFVLLGPTTVGFSVEAGPAPAFGLVIDPILKYSTYLGGSEADLATDLAVEPDGSICVVGQTSSANFPTLGAMDPTYNSGLDIFVARFAANGGALLTATFIGGSLDDEATSVSIDLDGNIYVTGATQSTDFPVKAAYDSVQNGEADVFLVKLAAGGGSIVFATYLGGLENEKAEAVAVGPNGLIWLTGRTESPGFPKVNAIDATLNGAYDAFVSLFPPAGKPLSFSTYLGGNFADEGRDAAPVSYGVYISGLTESPLFPVTAGAYDVSYNGNGDMWVAKLAFSGGLGSLSYSTFLGGTGPETDDCSINLMADGRVAVAGMSGSADFPVSPDAFDPSYNDNGDATISVLSPDLADLDYSTFFGGSSYEGAVGTAADADGNIFIVGPTFSTNLPLLHPFDSANMNIDGFVARLNERDGLVFSTYYGGSQIDLIAAAVVDQAGSVVFAGQTSSTDLPVGNAWDPTYNAGGSDGFVAKLYGINSGCCQERRGNINDDDVETPNISDLIFLVNYLFRAGPTPPCLLEANVDGDPGGQLNVADITRMVNFMFRGGDPLPLCP
ncbi:MAG TPA: SBBP repeat-containing protein [candidate division Zixibacteria bacterium]|nr:SBBP repeat-containing protein [candidate division Zixibacteria bacterium]